MGIWKININRNYCVIAYAMPTHSVHSPIPVKGIPEPPLVIAWIARYFFALAQRKETLMGKVQILAVLTMDGCQSSELYCKAYKELRLEDCGINEIRKTPFIISHPTIPSLCSTNGGNPQQTSAIWRKSLLKRRTTSMGCYVCVWWMKSYFIRFLSLPERESVSSSPPCHRNNGRWPRRRCTATEWSAISIKRAFDVRKMDECSGNEHFKSKIIPDRQINCKIITLKSSTLQRVCRIFYFMNTLFANHIHVRIPKNRV